MPLPEIISSLCNYPVGEPGRGLCKRQALLLEPSYELGKQERQEQPGRQRAGVLGKEKKVRKESKEAAGTTSGKCRGLTIWKTDWGLYLDCMTCNNLCEGEKGKCEVGVVSGRE